MYKVCIPNTFRDYYHYYSGEHKPIIGGRVWVSFHNRKQVVGIVIGEETVEKVSYELKSISAPIDEQPVLAHGLINLCLWISEYYQSPLSEVLPLALPKKIREGKPGGVSLIKLYGLKVNADTAHDLISPRAHKQHALIDFLADPKTKEQIVAAGFSSQQIKVLIDQQLVLVQEEIKKSKDKEQSLSPPLRLNEEQQIAVTEIIQSLSAYRCFLLYGVTGSGKTEVYLQVIAKVLAQEKQVLILVPEIGLTPQLLSRFTSRFKEPLAVIHSHLNDTERQEAWELAASDKVKIIIGTRSAIFTPMPTLGLIIVDEEHDPSFKQMDGVRYSARDTALMRAYQADIPIILGSATPSLETLFNSNNKYKLFRLNHKALNKTPLHYHITDIRNQPLQQGLAKTTLAKIGTHLEQGNQVLVFINRRGFAPVLLCHSCGWMADCKACDSHLTMHRTIGKLICHHCGLMHPIVTACNHCRSKELIPVGAGTQRIYAYLQSHFLNTSILRIDRDEVSKKNALNEHLEHINTGAVQLIVGTQMLAKGHHFPLLSLVVILDADNGFYNQDYRAIERLGQLLIQVAGRAGRAETAGEIIIQTHLPQHPLLNVLVQKGYDSFAQELLTLRKQANLPPFYYIALIRAQGRRQDLVLKFLHAMKDILATKSLDILGPAPAPLGKKANVYRLQLMVKSASRKKLQVVLTEIRDTVAKEKLNAGIRWSIDVDPMDLS